MLKVLLGLGYVVVRQNGSHRRFKAEGIFPLTFAFRDGESLAPGVVRDILVKQVGLSKDDALKAMGVK
ncbi:type II toxin-antitoxin system HicA family toxin [Embleya sp. NPDC050154]|uniref:type II toxin-antitoxin system HicA family toxin n=1 Tax=unclassified Embleya TaxID=2699296 RepID=UPI0037998426